MTGRCVAVHWLRATLLLLVCGMVSAWPAWGQGGTTGSVTGRVLQDPGGKGVRKVVVELTESAEGGGANEYRTATDASGVFRFEEVEPGKYVVALTRAGFFPPKKSAQDWTVTVEAGKELTGLVYKMQPTGVIAGRIVDGDGDPLANAGVNAIRRGKSASAAAQQAAEVDGEGNRNHATTNDLGEYRIADLEPGQYEIEVEPSMFYGPAPNPADKGKQKEKVLFTQTYYPGAMEEGQAGTVQVVSGGTVTANVTMLTNRAYRVSGTISGVGGAQLEQIVLVSRSGAQLQENVEDGGKFEFQNVQPGTYEARVVLLAGVGEGQRPTMKVELVKTPIMVESADVTGLELLPEAGGTVHGRFRTEDESSIDWTQVTIKLESIAEAGATTTMNAVDAQGIGRSDGVEVASDGTFEIADVPGGAYHVAVDVKSEIYRDYYVKSVTESGREVVDTGFSVTGGAGLEVVVSPKGGTIEGTVVGADGKSVTNAEVIAVPASAQRMRPGAYQMDMTNARGQYVLRGMNPGQYVMVALEGGHEDPRATGLAAKYATAGETVELGEGEKKSVTVKVAEVKE